MNRPEIVTNWSGLLRAGGVWDVDLATAEHSCVDRECARTEQCDRCRQDYDIEVEGDGYRDKTNQDCRDWSDESE